MRAFALFGCELPAHAPGAPGDDAGDDRDRDRGDDVGVEVVQILAALGEILHQLRPVVGEPCR